jgi:hypothetical protein
MQSSRRLFTPEEVERARRYHRPLYIALLVDTTLGLVTLSLLVFTHLSEVPAEERLIARGVAPPVRRSRWGSAASRISQGFRPVASS